MSSRPFPRASPYHQWIECCSPSTLCLGWSGISIHRPSTWLTDTRCQVGLSVLSGGGIWSTRPVADPLRPLLVFYVTTSLHSASSAMTFTTPLARPLPLAPDSLTLARLPGLGACRAVHCHVLQYQARSEMLLSGMRNIGEIRGIRQRRSRGFVWSTANWIIGTERRTMGSWYEPHRFEEIKMIIFVRSTHDW